MQWPFAIAWSRATRRVKNFERVATELSPVSVFLNGGKALSFSPGYLSDNSYLITIRYPYHEYIHPSISHIKSRHLSQSSDLNPAALPLVRHLIRSSFYTSLIFPVKENPIDPVPTINLLRVSAFRGIWRSLLIFSFIFIIFTGIMYEELELSRRVGVVIRNLEI